MVLFAKTFVARVRNLLCVLKWHGKEMEKYVVTLLGYSHMSEQHKLQIFDLLTDVKQLPRTLINSMLALQLHISTHEFCVDALVASLFTPHSHKRQQRFEVLPNSLNSDS